MKLTKYGIAGACMLIVTQVQALDFDFSGTIAKDNDIAQFQFSVGGASTVKVFSSSWDDGGFDPILAIWDSSGALIHEQDDGHMVGTTFSNGTGYTHGIWDSYYSVNLGAGTYTATVAQFNNFANGSNLSDGFTYDNNPDIVLSTRSKGFVFHILNVESASQTPVGVPDASSTLPLLGMAVLALGGIRRAAGR